VVGHGLMMHVCHLIIIYNIERFTRFIIQGIGSKLLEIHDIVIFKLDFEAIVSLTNYD
jgi:hypothetical protein